MREQVSGSKYQVMGTRPVAWSLVLVLVYTLEIVALEAVARLCGWALQLIVASVRCDGGAQ